VPSPATPLLFIVGPTAVGKTRLAVALAQRFHGEIINADSRQVYRHMDIGTAKPTLVQRNQAPHHLLDIRDPDEGFDLGSFLTLARSVVKEVHSRGKLPMVVGGTQRPSITSTWMRSAPPRSAARTASPRRVKSAARIDAAI
jgi:tRNA dimethylallyltransferase